MLAGVGEPDDRREVRVTDQATGEVRTFRVGAADLAARVALLASRPPGASIEEQFSTVPARPLLAASGRLMKPGLSLFSQATCSEFLLGQAPKES